MNTNIILILEGMQCIWWITLCIIFQQDQYIIIIGLSSASILIKLGLLLQFRKNLNSSKLLAMLLLILVDTVIYTEINLLYYQVFNPFSHYTNTLFIATNTYIIKEIVSKQISYQLLMLFYPCYIVLRLFSIVFINFDYTILESVIIILVFVIANFAGEKSLVSAKIRLTQQLNDDEQTDRHIRDIKFSKQKQNEFSHFNEQLKDKLKLRNLSIHSNKPQSYNDLSSIVKQKESIDLDKSDSQFRFSLAKILQIIPDGIIILNKQQKLHFVNKKCVKLLQCKNEELILPKLKDCLRNQIINMDNCTLNQQSQNNRKTEMNQQVLEEIIKKAQQNKVQVDIFDVLLNQNKYLYQLHQGTYDGEKSSIDDSRVSQNNQNQYHFNLSLESNKSLKLKIIQTHSILQNDIQIFGDQMNQPVLVLIIQDVTYKQKFQKVELKNQQFCHLLKKQLFQLRTPLNLSQQYLRIVSDVTKEQEQEVTEGLELLKCSTSFLQYQINNILDFLSYQLNEFAYFFCRFQINDLIDEIEQVFIPYIFQKKIQFQIRFSSSLSDRYFNSDKLRIVQVLLNILNHQCNNIIKGGEVGLTFLAKDDLTIQVIVENNSVQENRKKQFSFNQIMLKSQELDSCYGLMIHPELGFGLNLAARLASGLIEENNNVEVLSNSVDGNSISFLIQDRINKKEQDSILQKDQIQIFNKEQDYILDKEQDLMFKKQQNQILVRGQDRINEDQYDQIYEKDQDEMFQKEQTRNQSNTGGFMTRNKSQSEQQEDNFIVRKYCYQDNTNQYENSEKLVQKSEGLKSYESPNVIEDHSERIIIPQSNYFQFKSFESPRQIIINKTFSFKISTLQLHECNSTCKKILIVDDQIFNQIALKATLNRFAIQCDQAYDGYQAIQRVKEKQQTSCPFYDIIFMDIELPGLNGFETTKEIMSMGCKKSAIVIWQLNVI
ncbi:unnamed protein product (macronuclear) [Paramecium tetraurelia]|uniref:Response regulatory domain-containing protein n=1 Tax=Paramecium tetraurelia TaxID=5888 RepID=A0BRU0_PARTE|nr:uncharacterized protein GSPATT00031488001 [Paramecium tetraurelia]CAK61257.1 unnamed protein product [Paramecium tetraurelia]|eukprot:XP_001428655.1 hypothetical protein (macronuclear) [Paramecium tetraurelia strain d4-2]